MKTKKENIGIIYWKTKSQSNTRHRPSWVPSTCEEANKGELLAKGSKHKEE
jgi:hypothetical protein